MSTNRETAPADLTTLSPAEVDGFLASASDAAGRVEQSLEYAIDSVHRAAGDKRQGSGYSQGPWEMSLDDAMDMAERWALERGFESSSVKDVRQGFATLKALSEEIARLATEYARRGGWSRFFIVQNAGGHIHSSMNCSTCNKVTSRGWSQTKFGWLTELSGQSEEQAVAEQGAILCTVCFPSAPVEWTNKYDLEKAAKDAAKCPGSGTYLDQDKPHRVGYYSGNWATCPECGSKPSLTSTNKLRAHKPGKTTTR